MPEPLTHRELAVLQLLPTMQSNEEIAHDLLISVNTVKAYLKSLYRKLEVPNRRTASSGVGRSGSSAEGQSHHGTCGNTDGGR